MSVIATDQGARPPIRIVHLGIGAFFRAFGLAYLEKLNLTIPARDDRYGVMGVSFRSAAIRDALAAQNFVYTALERGADGDMARSITSLCDVAFSREEQSRILAQMADETVSIVSLTITEKGYCHHDGKIDLAHPDIAHDIANPDDPVSAPGYIVAALAMRRDAGIAPFTCLSCDNLSDNGRLLAHVVGEIAERVDPELAAWIKTEVRFPVTMIDRIVPATTDADLAHVATIIGHKDHAPVIHEPFSQWVIEDSFGALGRPDFGAVGAQMVADVAPFESMKLRCLNGSHTALAILGNLHGKATVSEAINDPALSDFVDNLWRQEICPSVDVPDGVDITAYCHALRERYRNAAIVHHTSQIATDTSKKLPPRILAPLADNLKAGRPVSSLCLILAGWMFFIRSAHRTGDVINDLLADRFASIINDTTDTDSYVKAMLEIDRIFSPDLIRNDDVVNAIMNWYRQIETNGIEACLRLAAKEIT